MKTCQGKSIDAPNQIIRADEQHKKYIEFSFLLAGLQGLLWLGWRRPILVEMASPPPTTVSDGSTSTCLPASSWTWPWLCLLRACLSSKCQ